VTITHKGFLARATRGKGERRIPISEVRAVELKPAGPVVNGWIEFAIAGGIEARSGLDHQTPRAAKNENSVIFTQRQAAAFEALRDAAEEAIAARQSGNADTSASVAISDRIASALRDSEAITTMEFVRTGTDRRCGSDRRGGTERRGPQSPIVERIGAATDRRDSNGDRRSQERRSGDDRRYVAAAPATPGLLGH
jgi:Domain of unknown function (DUF4429)